MQNNFCINKLLLQKAILFCLFFFLPILSGANQKKSPDLLSKELNFVYQPNSNSICKGFFTEKKYSNSSEEIRISADNAKLLQNNISQLSGNIEALYSDKYLTAQKAKIYPDNVTKKIKELELHNKVKLISNDLIITGKFAKINVLEHTGTIDDANYRMKLGFIQKDLSKKFSYGSSSKIVQERENYFDCKNATFTTCNPYIDSWHIKAKSVVIDREKQMLYAKHSVFYIKQIPIFYFPYFSFPIDGKRRSGFLYPSLSLNRFSIRIPYYINLAPNYDATIAPEYIQEHGINLHGEFRHLSSISKSKLNIAYLPFDQTLKNNPNKSSFLGKHRGKVDLKQRYDFTNRLSGNVDAHLVSDNDYLKDFNNSFNTLQSNLLTQKASIRYGSPHWVAIAEVTAYQTLKPLDSNSGSSPYFQLPKLSLNTNYTNVLNLFNLSNKAQYINLWLPDQNIQQQWQQIHKLHTLPSAELDLKKEFGYIRPKYSLHTTSYKMRRFRSTTKPLNSFNTTRVLPIYTVDSGLTFYRAGKYFQHYIKPRIMYSYIPMKEQNRIPSIDSGYRIVSFDNLFKANRFSGIDRVGDTNKLTYGISTELTRNKQNKKLLITGVGQTSYFNKREVTICTSLNCTDKNYQGYIPIEEKTSPTTMFVNLIPSDHFSWYTDIAYTFSNNSLYTFRTMLQIKAPYRSIFNISYSQIKNGDSLVETLNPNDNTRLLKQVNSSGYFSLTPYWSFYGGISYNINSEYFRHYFAGLEYNACCWVMRFLGGRAYQRLNNNNDPEFNNRFYIQFVLKGLGSYGENDIQKLLKTHIPGYKVQ